MEGETPSSRISNRSELEGETPSSRSWKSMTDPFPQRKQPPHLPPIERHNTPVVLFVTLVIRPRVNALANERFHEALCATMIEANAWRVSSYVVMPDHLHLFAIPNSVPIMGIEPWARFVKRRISWRLGAHPEWDWQAGCWDTQMRNRGGYEEQLSYTRMNPVRKGLAECPESWPWKGEGEPVIW
jgi:putative transposase